MTEVRAPYVSIQTPSTTARRVVGSIFMLPLALNALFFLYVIFDADPGESLVEFLPVLAAAMLPALGFSLLALWVGLRYLCATQLLSVEDGYLVSRIRVCIGPDLTHRVRLDEVRGREFEVHEYAKDERDATFRPSFSPRLILVGPRGPMLGAGIAMTMDEGVATADVLNQMIGSKGQLRDAAVSVGASS